MKIHTALLALPFFALSALQPACGSGGGDGDGDSGDGDSGDGDSGDGDSGNGDGDLSVGDGDIGLGSGGGSGGPSVCGDGILGDEEACDDANKADKDGCAATCLSLEPGFTCPEPGKACKPFAKCGDGIVSFPESCDDANLMSGDGCSNNCKEEIGFRCSGKPSTCEPTTCGDGIIEGAEACDHIKAQLVDGQPMPGSGCSAQCQKEPDCSGASCTSACGDGLRINEACDDGNTTSGDGCSEACEIEEGYDCTAECTIYDPDGDGEGPCMLDVPAIYRDVNVDFPDISLGGCGNGGLELGMVESTLDKDGKPVLSAKGISGGCITTQESFSKWYRQSAPDNATKVGSLLLFDNDAGGFVNRFGNNGDGLTPDKYDGTYDGNPLFFPVDDGVHTLTPMGSYQSANIPGSYGGGAGGTHNFHFTTEVQYWFTYTDDMDATLIFEGDDDVWVFMREQLVVDIGGIHGPQTGSVRLAGGNVIMDSGTVTAASLGLVDGNVYEIKVFQAERNVTGSSFKLTLAGFDSGRSNCTPNCGDGIIGAGEECDDGVNDGGYNECQPGCVLGGYCGDGEVQGNEACDDGDPDKPAGCSGCRILIVR